MGMEEQSVVLDPEGHHQLQPGTGGLYKSGGGLAPGRMLSNVLNVVPELRSFAQLDLKVAFNKDSSNVGPSDWVRLARMLDAHRGDYDAFLIAHGTDTMAYTAAALSLMLAGFRKPVVLTGSQLPLALPRSDARQNLIDAMTCATAWASPPHVLLQEVAICFGGRLLRGNRSRKVNSSAYAAFDSPAYSPLAVLGVDVDWRKAALLQPDLVYRPRFNLDSRVIRLPIVPGSDPRLAYGDLHSRGVRGVVLEAFGVGNLPDLEEYGWMPWLRQQRSKGLQIYLASQCPVGRLQPELYKSGALALKLGVESGPSMTPECAAVKLMLTLKYPDLPMGMPLAGEL